MTFPVFDFFIQNSYEETAEVKTEVVEVKREPISYEDLPATFIGHVTVKTEPVMPIVPVKSEAVEPTVPADERAQYAYKCRICKKIFESKIAFTCHVNKHTKRCVNCRLVFKTWKEVDDHEEFCPRRFGRIVLPKRSKPAVPKTLRYKCQLCKRKYETKDHLFKHQFRNCSKRYVTPAWIVKI